MTNDDHRDEIIQDLVVARAVPAVVKIRFLAFASNCGDALIFALEGEDDKIVYSRWLYRICVDLKFEIFICNGKRNAKSLSWSLHNDMSGQNYNVKLIVDRDFDDLSGFPPSINIFMTDRYSFENYLIDPENIDNILPLAFPCHGNRKARDYIIGHYKSDLRIFSTALEPLNERIYVGRKLGRSIDQYIPKTTSRCATVSFTNVKKEEYDPTTLIPFNIDDDKEVSKYITEFKSLDPMLRHRGKFLWKFFVTWSLDLGQKFSSLEFRESISVGEGRVNNLELTLGALAVTSPMPVGLSDFVTHHCEPT